MGSGASANIPPTLNKEAIQKLAGDLYQSDPSIASLPNGVPISRSKIYSLGKENKTEKIASWVRHRAATRIQSVVRGRRVRKKLKYYKSSDTKNSDLIIHQERASEARLEFNWQDPDASASIFPLDELPDNVNVIDSSLLFPSLVINQSDMGSESFDEITVLDLASEEHKAYVSELDNDDDSVGTHLLTPQETKESTEDIETVHGDESIVEVSPQILS